MAEALTRDVQDPGALAPFASGCARPSARPVQIAPVFGAHVRDTDVIPHDLGDWRCAMTTRTDLIERLRAMGLRPSTEALVHAAARPAPRPRHAHADPGAHSTPSAREANNLARRRTRLAMVGTPKPLDRFDWSFLAPSTAPCTSRCTRWTSPPAATTCSARRRLRRARPPSCSTLRWPLLHRA
ncbi:MAG: hypothetical protein R3A52_02725 [Polyangiales bacterium]